MSEHRDPPRITAITGAGGWLGRALVAELAADPLRRLRLLAADSAEAARLQPLGHEVVVGDIAKRDTAPRLLHGLGAGDDVIHTAGVIHPARVRQFYAVNTSGTRNVVEAALDAGVRRLVHVSSNSPFGTNARASQPFRANEPYQPYYGYGRSKMLAEEAVRDGMAGGLDAVIVRPPWFYGPHQPPRQTTFFRMVRAGRFPVIGDGQQQRSMVYVGNLVDGVVAAELVDAARGGAFWIADARPYSVNEIVETVGAALRDEGFSVKPPTTRLPVLAAGIAERIDAVTQGLGFYLQRFHVLGEMGKHIACDISASRDVLGYQPAVDLYEGMRRSIRWCVEQGLSL